MLAFQAGIQSYDEFRSEFPSLRNFFENVIPQETSQAFLTRLLPQIARLALDLETLVPQVSQLYESNNRKRTLAVPAATLQHGCFGDAEPTSSRQHHGERFLLHIPRKNAERPVRWTPLQSNQHVEVGTAINEQGEIALLSECLTGSSTHTSGRRFVPSRITLSVYLTKVNLAFSYVGFCHSGSTRWGGASSGLYDALREKNVCESISEIFAWPI